MQHPFAKLESEYTQLLGLMVVRPECKKRVDDEAVKIIGFKPRFEQVEQAVGVPVIFSGPSFYREADLNFNLSPAQGDPWRKVSTHVPRDKGPYPSWIAAAIDSYRIEHLDKVGRENWTWELICFYAEMFNGFGYRDVHHMHSPYLWGGTNIQMIGKYDADGVFDAGHMDEQLGVIPIAKRMVELAPELALGPKINVEIPKPTPTGLATSANPSHSVKWLQEGLNELGFNIRADGIYGRETKNAVARFEGAFGLEQNGGYAYSEVLQAIEKAMSNLKSDGFL